MLQSLILNNYINGLSVQKVILICELLQINMTEQEINIVLPILKQYGNRLIDDEYRRQFIRKIAKNTSDETASKLDVLFNKLMVILL